MTQDVLHAELEALLQRIGYPDSASAFHGGLCGLLSVVEPAQASLQALLDAAAQDLQPDRELQAGFARLREQSLKGLMSPDMDFELLLPDDDQPLDARVQALAGWCEGFLYGFGSGRTLDLENSSEEAREMIRDLSQFTQAGMGGDEDEQVEETAYAELVEYVRVGAQLLFMEFHPRAAPAVAPDSHTLH
jgi:uncharacterized protein YgfB (UPF0149 family)